MIKFLKDTKLILATQTIILALLMSIGAFIVYVLADGGNIQNFIQDIQFIGTISVIGAYMSLASVSTSLMAYKQGVYQIDDECKEIEILKDKNANLNNSIGIREANEFLRIENSENFKQKQHDANEEFRRQLTAKIYKKENDVLIGTLKEKKKKTKNKYYAFIIKIRLKWLNRHTKQKKLLSKLDRGKLNAKVKNYKSIKRKDITSIKIEPTKDKTDIKLKSNLKSKTLASSVMKAVVMNLIYSYGLVLALRHAFDYDFGTRWIGLALFMIFFILSLTLQYFVYFLSTKKNYEAEALEILRNRNYLLNKCILFISKKAE